MLKNGVQGKVIQVAMLFALVVTKVYEVFNIVVGSYVLYILKRDVRKDT